MDLSNESRVDKKNESNIWQKIFSLNSQTNLDIIILTKNVYTLLKN